MHKHGGQAREYLALALRVECTKDSTTNGSLVGSPSRESSVDPLRFTKCIDPPKFNIAPEKFPSR